jgi:predicted MFS family arabinose efflux permease
VARFSIETSAGLAFSAAIGGLVAHFVSWRAMLIGYAMIALLPSALLWRLPPGRPARAPGKMEPTERVHQKVGEARHRRIVLAVSGVGLAGVGVTTAGIRRRRIA